MTKHEPAILKLILSETGTGSATLNGMDISNIVLGIEFKSTPLQLTEIKLTILAELDAEVSANLEKIALAKPEDEKPKTVRLADGRVLPVSDRRAS